MTIKLNKASMKGATGVPRAEASVSPATDGHVARVTVNVSWVDAFDDKKIICGLRMSPEEARSLANRLMVRAMEAEGMLQNEQTVIAAQVHRHCGCAGDCDKSIRCPKADNCGCEKNRRDRIDTACAMQGARG